MATPIGLYRAHITTSDRLAQTTVGRSDMLEDLLEKLQRNAGKKGKQHYLFVGPRGIGKTHFLSLVENAVESREVLRGLYAVIRFPEENNRILSFADILLEIVRILGDEENSDEWREIYSSFSAVDKDQEIVDAIVPRLKHHRKRSGKTLLLLMENMDVLFTKQIKNEQDIHRFRTFLMDSPCAVLIGSSPVFFPGLTNARNPFYEFFDIQVLEDFSEELTLDLVEKNLEMDNRSDLLDRRGELWPKIRALHTMTGGNPRLIMMLYELIAYDNILEVKEQLQKLLDRITPFYQDRMKELAPQERALLETMALMRTDPRTPAAIAARMRKPPQQISSLLKRMTKAGYLTVSENPRDKRSRIYRIKEGFFDLWLAMGESRGQSKRLLYLVKLLEVWYRDPTEREEKRRDLRQSLQDTSAASEVRENRFEYLNYLSEVGDADERSSAKLELSLDYLKAGAASKAKDLLRELKPIAPARGIFIWMTDQALQWSEGGSDLDVRKWFDGLIQYWKTQRSGDLEKAVGIAQRLGIDLSGHGLHKIRIELLRDALACASRPQEQIALYHQMAQSQKMDGQLNSALDSLRTALELCKKIKDKAGEGVTLNNISGIYHARGDYDSALEFLQKSLKIRQEIGDKAGMIPALHNMGHVALEGKEPKKAIQYWSQALSLAMETKDAVGIFHTAGVLGQVYAGSGDTVNAMELLTLALETGERAGLPRLEPLRQLLTRLKSK